MMGNNQMRRALSARMRATAQAEEDADLDGSDRDGGMREGIREEAMEAATVVDAKEADNGATQPQGEPSKSTDLGMAPRDVLESGIDELAVVQDLYHRVKTSKIHTDNYLSLCGFILLTSLYLAIIYLQADSFRTFQVSSAHLGLLPDGVDGTGGFVFSTTNDLYGWLNDSIIQVVWQNSQCGNGLCERPDEYMSFGRFGCRTDCGQNPNVSQIVVTIKTDFASEEAMTAASWNLQMIDPAPLLWYEENVQFNKLISVTTVSLNIPDGNWTLLVEAPLGGVTGSITYNDTSNSELVMGDSLVFWEKCAANRSDTPFGICRQTAGSIALCAKEFCTANNASLNTLEGLSSVFVDLAGKCDADFNSLDAFIGLPCTEVTNLLTYNNTGDFASIQCTIPSQRRLLQESSSSMWTVPTSSPNSHRRMMLGDSVNSPSAYSSILWSSLGPSDTTRLSFLQIATQRALFSWVKDSCLASNPVPVNTNSVLRMSSFFCTFFGGPVTLSGCAYTNTSGEILYSDQDLASEMKRIHARLNVTASQERKFVDIFMWALMSVVDLTDATQASFRERMHQLDTQIVNEDYQGCSYVAQVLPWIRGRDYTTQISVGESITWVWEDDLPHSLREEGLGDNPVDIFDGMGSGRFVVSRNTICNKDNMGVANISLDPMPCALVDPKATVNLFTYTKYFAEPGNYSYADSYDSSSRGVVVVTESMTAINDELSIGSLATTCSPGCTLGMLRNGKCNSLCNTLECAFDGGDCSCSPNEFGIELCDCPEGQTMATDGTCCSSYGVGSGLSFPFYLSLPGTNVSERNANFLPQTGPPLFRYISVANRVLVGMSLRQKRWASGACKEGRFTELYPNCTHGSSTATYGVNPVFLPTSVLYNAEYSGDESLYYNGNYSLGTATQLNSQGIPYGFDAFTYGGSSPTFHYLFDINYNNEEATESLQYLIDGFFIDNATKELTVELITYNGIAHFFTLFKVQLTFQIGGKIALSYDVQSITAEPYRRPLDWFRFVLEIIFLVCIIWNIMEELREMITCYRVYGSILSHFAQLWNVLDFISLSIMVAAIALWINYVITEANPFDIDLRYEIYDIVSWTKRKLYWDIVPPGVGFSDAMEAFNRIEKIVYFRTYYVALQGINVLLMVLRILKLMDFQPRMGTITRTLAAATDDLLHFFILFFIVFFGFAMYGHLVFGRTIKEFRSLAISLNTCFNALLGDDSVNAFLVELKGWELLAAMLFWWSFIILMVFIIFNLLIGIIVDAFVKVREEVGDAPSMPAEVLHIIRTMSARMFSPLRTDRQILKQLRALGADKGLDMAKNGEKYGVDPSLKKTTKLSREQLRNDLVLKVEDQEIDGPTLGALLERASLRQAESEYRLRRRVDPKMVANIIFDQYRQEPAEEDEEPIERVSSESLILNEMESMKKDMAELKELVRSLVGTGGTRQQ